MAEIFSFPISVQRIENTLISIISPSRTCYKSLALSKVTSAKNSVKSIPEELAEQSREHYPIEKNNKNQRKESGASAQTSASGAQNFYPYDYFKPLYEPSLKSKRFTGLRNTFEIINELKLKKKCPKKCMITVFPHIVSSLEWFPLLK